MIERVLVCPDVVSAIRPDEHLVAHVRQLRPPGGREGAVHDDDDPLRMRTQPSQRKRNEILDPAPLSHTA